MRKTKIAPLVLLVCSLLLATSVAAANQSIGSAGRSEGPSYEGVPTYHFLFEGYVDELWLSFNPDGTVNGYDDAPGFYYAPVLGVKGPGAMVLFIDFPTPEAYYELMMLIVDIPSLSATGYLTIDGLLVDGPYAYQLIYAPLSEDVEGSGGAALGTGGGVSEVEPELMGLYLRPYVDEEWFDILEPGKVKGYADVPGHPSYPAPHLGVIGGGMLIFADDYKPGGYELRLNKIYVSDLTGVSWATVDGVTVDGPMDVWLEWM